MNTHTPEDANQSPPEGGNGLSSGEVTQLLLDWNKGDEAARDRIVTLVYDELRWMAHQHLQRERAGHSVQTGTLVHEVYLRLFEANGVPCHDRKGFLGIAARLMRQVLVDAARKRDARKRGGNPIRVSLEYTARGDPAPDLVKLDEALTDLARRDEELNQVVELRYFAGYTIAETAKILGVSIDTVKRRWKRARIYLYDELTRTKEVVHVASDDTPKE